MFNLPRALLDAEDAYNELSDLMDYLNEHTSESIDPKRLDEYLTTIELNVTQLREQADKLQQ